MKADKAGHHNCTRCQAPPAKTFSNGVCKTCYMKQYRQDNKQALLEYGRQYAQCNKLARAEYNKQYQRDNKTKVSARKKLHGQQYYQANKEVLREAHKAYYRANKQRINQHNRQYGKKYRQENASKINAKTAKRHARKLRATPSWLTKEQLLQLEEVYKAAALSGRHVDHIVPLQGKNVSGLHVPWNVRPIAPFENYTKLNKLPPHEEQLAWTPANLAS